MGNHLDSRELQKRIDELEALETRDEEEADELEALKTFKDDVGSDEWKYGIDFIPVDDFEDFAHELAEDVGAISKATTWPCNCIDWEQAAKELSYDYSMGTYNGEDYYYRV